MTVTTEFLLGSPSLPLVGLAGSIPSSHFECVHGLCLERDSRVFVVYLDPADDVSEDDVAALDEVVETTSLGRASGNAVYQITVELDDVLSEAFAPERFTAAQMEPTIVTPEGWYERKLFESFESFNGFRARCEEYGLSIELISITPDPPTPEESSRHGLTERQHEALSLAVARGYYESPRQVTAEELADELDISQPSMSSLLRRGERQLISSALDSGNYINALSR